MTVVDGFPGRVVAERARLAALDPAGELDAVKPLFTAEEDARMLRDQEREREWRADHPREERAARPKDTEPSRDVELIGERGTIGSRTAADLHHGDPPAQLVGQFLTPEGPTILYGRGGVGKGITACWFALRLVAAGHVPMIVDFEGHEREWGSRLRGLGMTDEQLAQVHYRAPFGQDWTAPKGALSAVANLVREDAERVGATYLIVDSYSLATSNGDTMGGEAAAREYFSGLARIGLPNLTIAHVRGDSGRFPDRPFGSVHVHNFARETWAVEPTGSGPAATDTDEIRFGPHVVGLEFRNQKANGRGKAPAQFLTFSFHLDGSIEVHADPPGTRTVAELAADVLAKGPMTYRQLIAAIDEDTGQTATVDGLRKALERAPQRFRWDNDKRPGTWALR
jgi:hypothetical protein